MKYRVRQSEEVKKKGNLVLLPTLTPSPKHSFLIRSVPNTRYDQSRVGRGLGYSIRIRQERLECMASGKNVLMRLMNIQICVVKEYKSPAPKVEDQLYGYCRYFHIYNVWEKVCVWEVLCLFEFIEAEIC